MKIECNDISGLYSIFVCRIVFVELGFWGERQTSGFAGVLRAQSHCERFTPYSEPQIPILYNVL